MIRMVLLEFCSVMESFGITDRNFLSPLYSQLIEADGFGGDGLEFAVAVNPRRKTDINDATCLAAMSLTVQASAYTRNARAARLRFSP